ncbi:MAG: anaerobic glycerol-3-phosphate dehydrogenase subunit A [Candidatus Desulfovibrio kirbyi]|uniref:Anaerobic glycerol-3-phosphate dehydrogenase subunit A n=1 Tax=Candidatus Desulfovibrio kirbyi TaxID=2696086 RepID=A0A6L2R5C5_9BACT|nr:MAG: anaerobic glycerol-3-phosphate dehydrogenase subunit A [Candidatus Desulfovibrio kirbyi]
MQQTRIVVIGGGATGIGILRDLSMRGVPAVLLEQGGLANGTSSRFHGLLHSGARYAASDLHAACECIEENTILRRIGRHCVEEFEGLFVLTREDDPAYVAPWLAACARAGIITEEISVEEARAREPALAPDIRQVFRVPDAGVDGFRLVWHNAESARRYGGEVRTYHKVTGIESVNGKITGLTVCNTLNRESYPLACEYIVNAAGPWSGEIARLAGQRVDITPDRGTLLAFNHRFTSHIVNRLHKSADGDIFVPHGSITILGTTSAQAKNPADTTPTPEEVLRLLSLGEKLFPDVWEYRILRVFAGNRPLYTPPDHDAGRGASRNFVIVDHEQDGLAGFASIFGGKLTTYRLMAEKMTDLVCAKLGVATPCRTAGIPLAAQPARATLERAGRRLPAHGARLVAERLGDQFPKIVNAPEQDSGADLLCECEMVTRAEVELVAADPTTHFLHDIRFRTRLGMGTCQGTCCSLRAVGVLSKSGVAFAADPRTALRTFLQERWRGLRPVLWGAQAQKCEFNRALYGATLNLNGADDEAD